MTPSDEKIARWLLDVCYGLRAAASLVLAMWLGMLFLLVGSEADKAYWTGLWQVSWTLFVALSLAAYVGLLSLCMWWLRRVEENG